MATPGEHQAEHREVTLKDVVINCLPQDSTNPVLDGMTVVIHGLGEEDTAGTERITPKTWKYHREIKLHKGMNKLVLSIKLEDTGDIGYVVFLKDELATFMRIDKNIKLERDVVGMEEISPSLRLSFSLTSGESQNTTRELGLPVNITPGMERLLDAMETPEHFSAVIMRFSDNPKLLQYLGHLFNERFLKTNREADINKAISTYRLALESIPSDNTNYGIYVRDVGLALFRRFELSGRLADINEAISMMEVAITYTTNEDENMPALLNNLGAFFHTRFKHTGDLADISSAISTQQRAVQYAPEGHVYQAVWFSNLSDSFQRRSERTENLMDITSAISTMQRAIQLTPEGHADMPARLSSLGDSFQRSFEHTGNLADIASAITTRQRAVQLTQEGHADMPTRLANLGNSFRRRSERTGNLADIASAITTHQRAVQLIQEGHADMPIHLDNLGNSLQERFECTGNLPDIAEAITNHQKAIQLTPKGHADMPARLSNLGNSFQRRFESTGDLTDISSAIYTHQKAVQLTPEGHGDMPAWLSHLGNSFKGRFESTGNLLDISSAISIHQRAIQLTREGDAGMPSQLNNLGISLHRRFERTGDLEDISSAISTIEKAIQLTPNGHADMPARLSNLGSSFQRRFENTGGLADIESAISIHQRAIYLTPEGHADMPNQLSNLGSTFLKCFERTGDLADITSAISTHQKAVHLTPQDHTNMPSRLMLLGISFERRFTSTHNMEDIHEAISAFRCAATQFSGLPSIRLNAARGWAKLSRLYDKVQLLSAFSVAIQLLPQVAGLEKTIHTRHLTIINISYLTASATAAAVEESKPEIALSWLEQGRCLVWSQLNHLRHPANALQNHTPALAKRFLRVARALETSGSRRERRATFSEENMEQMISLQEESHTHIHLAKEWNELLVEIRRIPEFHDFLQPPEALNILARLPPDGPIVIFNIHKDRCDALALISNFQSPIPISLATFSLDKAMQLRDKMRQFLTDHRVRQRQEGDRGTFRLRPEGVSLIHNILRELWEHVVKPILDALAYLPRPTDLPRIWWCPTGPLVFLPIHAAGIYGEEKGSSGPCLSDYVVSSYTPTISSLLDKLQEVPDAEPKSSSLLIVSQPSTPGQSPIPGARQEAHALRDMIGPLPKSLLLEDSAATMARVKEAMKSHSSVHFACHAIQHPAEPLQSGVQLHDGRLELLEMMGLTLPNADLAFLSACQTSTGDEKLSDEVVHLAAGMLAAGYRSVVATMWSIKDQYAPVIAEDFYSHILTGQPDFADRGVHSAKAARALHHAMQNIRNTLGDTEDALLTWVPYVHFGV